MQHRHVSKKAKYSMWNALPSPLFPPFYIWSLPSPLPFSLLFAMSVFLSELCQPKNAFAIKRQTKKD